MLCSYFRNFDYELIDKRFSSESLKMAITINNNFIKLESVNIVKYLLHMAK